jgi:hypothetical protein
MINPSCRFFTNTIRDQFLGRLLIQVGGISPKKFARSAYASVLLFALNGLAYGQSTSGTSEISFRILDQHQVRNGLHSIFLNRVAPPVFPAPKVEPEQTPSPEFLQWQHSREQKTSHYLNLGATVYDGKLSDVTWSYGDKWVRAISNVDFKYLSGGMGEFETPDSIYEFFLMTSEVSSAAISHNTQTLALLAKAHQRLPAEKAAYMIVDGNAINDAEVLAELDAVHAYYSANKTRLISEYHQRIADWENQERWNKAHPPVEKDAVINFWPVKSAIYLKGTNQ